MPAAIAPDCEINAKSPGSGIRAAKVALNWACGAITPRQFGPTSRKPVARAAFSQLSAREPGPRPRPAVMMIAAGTPFSPAAETMAGTVWGGAVTTMTSGACGKSRSEATVLKPSMSP
jgi:hypothetical protein